eukprot:16321939-Heterocapsa_arctica.AAC.1
MELMAPPSRIRDEVLLRVMSTEEVVPVLLDAAHGDIGGRPLPRPVQVDRDVLQLGPLHFVDG